MRPRSVRARRPLSVVQRCRLALPLGSGQVSHNSAQNFKARVYNVSGLSAGQGGAQGLNEGQGKVQDLRTGH